MRTAAILVLALLIGGCTRGTPPPLAEMILRQQLTEVPEDFVACVSVDGEDGDTELITALGSSDREVVPISECTWDRGGSYHRSSGRKAMLMDVTANLFRGEVTYKGRHHGKWATYLTLQVREDGDGWRVVKVLKHEMA